MLNGIVDFNFRKVISKIDWKLLLFLMLFLNVKLAIKIPAIIIIYLLRFNFRFKFSFKNSRLPLFYLLIMLIPFIDLIVNKGYTNPNYLGVFFMGMGFWLLCILAIHQVKLSVENTEAEIIHRTILVFFVINAFISFYNFAGIVWETGAINPYRYQGQYQKYFIGTGDYIKGLTFDTSTTNAALNAIGVIYFLVRKNNLMVLLCMAVLLFTGSNFLNIALIFILALLFIFRSTKDQKSLIVVCLMMLVVFMVKISPQNDRYAVKTFSDVIHPPNPQLSKTAIANKCTNIPTLEETRRRIAIHYLDSIKKLPGKKPKKLLPYLAVLPKTGQGRIFVDTADINSLAYQSIIDTTAQQHILLNFIDAHKNSLPLSAQKTFKPGLPGKIIGFLQTVLFFKEHPSKIIAGAGIGKFSSKLAFRATSFGFAGGYSAKHNYINSDFLTNHLDVYLNFFSRRSGLHSLTNSPYSVYDQLMAEYGLLGLLVFAIYYLGFFAKHHKTLTYGLPLLLLLMMIFFTDYWFEQLSVIVFFELLLLLNIKETTNKAQLNYGSE
ncbi:hypothetical protein [Mucilaginibacter sp. OK098]|uniref:hypothetical protein n=1 Tax=Mucilaginibacter sp. OK098 TaxID=1855297 RepID=UPI000921887A|nr:hypothetical protein [Mucilaginibacter sp. OK098]SHN27819.1 hypothetical protein SAMN05216524_10880 [Mucilaginibacter sp. OK098]